MRTGFYLLAFKRLMRSIYFPAILFLTAVLIVLASLSGDSESLPAAGVYDDDKSVLSEKVADRLFTQGFIIFESEDALRHGISDGLCDCGVVLTRGFEMKIKTGDTNEIARFLESPESFAPALYRDHIIAAIYREYAPYITSQSLDGADITEEEILSAYEEMMADGMQFTFAVEETDRDVSPAASRTETYVMCTSSLLLFAVIIYASVKAVTSDTAHIARRTGVSSAMRSLVIPEAVVRTLALFLVPCAVSIFFTLTSDHASAALTVPLMSYILLLSSFGMLISSVLPRPEYTEGAAFFILLSSLLLLPMYFDAALVFPAIRGIRPFLPTYWLWLCREHTITGAAAGVISVPAAFAARYFRLKKEVMIHADRKTRSVDDRG